MTGRSATSIATVEILPLFLSDEETATCEGPVEALLVRITDEAGRSGIGECDSPPLAVKAFIEMPTRFIWRQNMVSLLEGKDARDIAALWQRLYEGTASPGRRGLGIHALSAIDMALHDLAGKQLGLPVHRLLGGARSGQARPYATLFVGHGMADGVNRQLDALVAKAEQALALGFRALKVEALFGAAATDAQLVQAVRSLRRMLGDEVVLMLDFGYRWHDWQEARAVLAAIAECDIYFAEATLQHDDLRGHARLSETSPVRICGGEWAVTRWEVLEWITLGKVSVVQPDPSRCGGLTEMRRIAELCELHGVQCIPHAWKTGILAYACLHLQAACPNIPYIEMMAPQLYPSPLASDLIAPSLAVNDGLVTLPQDPGLGFTLDEDCVARYCVKPER